MKILQKTYTTYATTALALIAFAANSVLCRLALKEGNIDPATFTSIRLFSALIMLWILIVARRYFLGNSMPVFDERPGLIRWCSSIALFSYALLFSLAYLTLDTGVGALLLFVSVQVTMLTISFIQGQRIKLLEAIGLFLSLAGFVALFIPDILGMEHGIFSPVGVLLMIVSGVAWGIYSLLGRISVNPLLDSTHNFLRTLPFVCVLILLAFLLTTPVLTYYGFWLAVMSGALASGVGYALWYTALKGLSSTQGAVVQLTVPIIAALGGVMFADEQLSAYIVVCSAVVLLGVFLVNIAARKVTE